MLSDLAIILEKPSREVGIQTESLASAPSAKREETFSHGGLLGSESFHCHQPQCLIGVVWDSQLLLNLQEASSPPYHLGI